MLFVFKISFFFVCFNFLLFAKSPELMEMKWFDGNVEDAFKIAKMQSKPMFLYWGAVWCPPCNQMKKTVFTTKIFQDELNNFVAIYLDGDTKAAQIWGEKLKSFSYPTMLILDSSGKEVSRLPTGLDSQNYVKLMTQIRGNLKSIKELIAGAQKGALVESEWSMLANYSWAQDEVQNAKEEELEKLFNLFYVKSSQNQAFKSSNQKFFLMSLDQQKKRESFTLSAETAAILKEILYDQNAVYSNREYFFYSFWSLLEKIKNQDNSRFLDLSTLWATSMEKLSKRADLSTDEKLMSTSPELFLAKDQKKLTKESLQKLKNAVKKADTEARDPYTRQAAMSTAIWLLREFDMQDEAYKYALKETRRSPSPYYFMSDLAIIEKKRGNRLKSHEWNRQAWQATQGQGRATRLQWGVSYLISLIEDEKSDLSVITATFNEIMSDNLLNSDAFAGRNKSRLSRIVKSLKKSNRATELQKTFSQSFKKLCPKNQLSECEAWTKQFAGEV